MPYMYILQCSDGTFTPEAHGKLSLRLSQHQEGVGAVYTASRLPVNLVFCEWYESIETAFQREKQVQGWSRAKKEALMAGHPEWLADLAKNRMKS